MSSWNNAYDNSSNDSSTTRGEWSYQELSILTKILAVLLLVIGLLGISSGTMYLVATALRAAGIDPANFAAAPPTPSVENRPQFNFPKPTFIELMIYTANYVAGTLISIGMIVSAIQTLRRRRSGAIWLSNFCILSALLVIAWGLQTYFFYDSFKKPLEAMMAAQDNLPPEIPPERVAEFQERMEYITNIGLALGFGCVGLISLFHFLLYLIGAIHFRSERVLERMRYEGMQ